MQYFRTVQIEPCAISDPMAAFHYLPLKSAQGEI
jgi:hypothetical protein